MRFAGSAQGWKVAPSKVLGQKELDAVLGELIPKSQTSLQALVKLVIFRLACFTGLRVGSICGLNMADVVLDVNEPFIRIRAENAKNHKANEVPIFSKATVSDLRRWRDFRLSQDGVTADSPFVCSVSADAFGHRFSRFGARQRFISACKCLGEERHVSIHYGRHSCCAMALHMGLPVTVVRDMLSHSSISVTNTYAGIFKGREAVAYSLDG